MTFFAFLAFLAFLAPSVEAAGNESRLPVPVLMTTRTFESGRGEIVGMAGLGVVDQQYDKNGTALTLTNGARYVQLMTGFQGSFGVLPALEAGWEIPLWHTVYVDPVVGLTSKLSGGGLGDVSAWMKFRWLELGPFSSAVWGGMKWPMGKWTGLNVTLRGTDQTGTGSQETFLGAIFGYEFDGGAVHMNIRHTITGSKTFVDSLGAAVDQNDGDRTVVSAGLVVRVMPGLEGGLPVIFENISGVKQNDVQVDRSDRQWLAVRPGVSVRMSPEVIFESAAEVPLRGVNYQRTLTFLFNFRYEF